MQLKPDLLPPWPADRSPLRSMLSALMTCATGLRVSSANKLSSGSAVFSADNCLSQRSISSLTVAHSDSVRAMNMLRSISDYSSLAHRAASVLVLND